MPRRKKGKALIIRNLLKGASRVKTTQLLYILLLVAVFLLGYLVAQVQLLNKSAGAPKTTATTAAPPDQTAPDAREIAKKLTNGHLPIIGERNARVKIVEFADFRCPYCERFFKDTIPQLIKEYVETGKASFAFRHYQFLGEASIVAGNAAECANEQGKFWEFHDWLYNNQPPESDTATYGIENLTSAAPTLGINTDQFRSCLSEKKFNDNLQKDFSLGQSVGVSGTPTIYINGRQIVGAQPYAVFKTLIEEELKK